ncbi:hypothetical protein IEO21_05771 [Rhodonia placenta]|uniref:Uncharacterized protein n=1 Tax=Rhodonia placenta TaxID=104341 RepID=A0A8H7P185_9APHY|nr:hypothetical protein IEO21_05771 [Postia placenta]
MPTLTIQLPDGIISQPTLDEFRERYAALQQTIFQQRTIKALEQLGEFPRSLWIKILLHISWRDLMAFRQYKIELGYAGLIDGSPEAPRRRRLEVLHKLQRSWRTPLFSIPVYGYLQHTYSVISCGIMAQLVAADTIELSLLPSSLRGQLKPLLWKTITVPNVSNIMCFYVDPAQDLLVIQETVSEPTYHGRTHLRSLEMDGNKHPLARGSPFLGAPSRPVIVQGALLGFPYLCGMHVLNWRTGNAVWYAMRGSYVCSMHYPVLYDDITFRRTLIDQEARSYRSQENAPFHADPAVRHLFSLTMKVARDVAWENWGPMGTRMFEQPTGPSKTFVSSSVLASQCLTTCRARENKRPHLISIYETNPMLVTREARKHRVREGKSKMIAHKILYDLGPSSLTAEYLFKDVITTSWPYRLVQVEVPHAVGDIVRTVLLEDSILAQIFGNREVHHTLGRGGAPVEDTPPCPRALVGVLCKDERTWLIQCHALEKLTGK